MTIDITHSSDKNKLHVGQLRQSRKLIENDINRMTTRIINLEAKNDKDLQKILDERKKTEQLIQKRYENFYIKEQIRLNKEKDLQDKREKIQARNGTVNGDNYHCSQSSVIQAQRAIEDH